MFYQTTGHREFFMSNVPEEDIKKAMKEALKEWLDEKFTAFGKWSLGAIAALALAALVYFILKMNGWQRF